AVPPPGDGPRDDREGEEQEPTVAVVAVRGPEVAQQQRGDEAAETAHSADYAGDRPDGGGFDEPGDQGEDGTRGDAERGGHDEEHRGAQGVEAARVEAD